VQKFVYKGMAPVTGQRPGRRVAESEAMSYLRSLLFSIPLVFLSTVFMGAVSLAASFFDPTGNSQHRIARVWARMLLAVSFITVRAEGLDKLDPHGSYVFVANHASFMDIPAILARLPYQFPVLRQEKPLRNPFSGYAPAPRGAPASRSLQPPRFAQEHDEGGRLIAQRGCVRAAFPEGGRAPQGLREFKDGAAYIAIKAGVPVVPIAIVGMRPLLPMGAIHYPQRQRRPARRRPHPHRGLKPSGHTALTQRLYRGYRTCSKHPPPHPCVNLESWAPPYACLPWRLCFLPALPAAEFTTYIADTNDYHVARVAADSAGNTYIAGSRTVGSVSEAVVMKLDPTGKIVLFIILSGKGGDAANDLAVDARPATSMSPASTFSRISRCTIHFNPRPAPAFW